MGRLTKEEIKRIIELNRETVTKELLRRINSLDSATKESIMRDMLNCSKDKDFIPMANNEIVIDIINDIVSEIYNKQQRVYITREMIKQINSETNLTFKSNVKNISGMLNKAAIMGQEVTKLEENMYIIKSKDNIKIVSDKQISLPTNSSCLFERTIFKYIDFKGVNTSDVEDMSYMFSECRADNIDLSSFDTSNVVNMSYMFYRFEADNIDLSSFNTSNVKNMGCMFYNCKAKILDLTSFDTSNVEDMGAMFWFCEAESIDLSSFDTSNVEDMYNMFYECKVESLDLRNFNTCQVKDMQYMFCNCRADYIDLSSFDTSKVENTQYMFVGCKAGLVIKDKRLLEEFNNYIKVE